MKILGVFNSIDANATLSVGGTIVGAMQEERITREKFISGWPAKSIASLLKHARLEPSDIDVIASGAWSHPDAATLSDYFTRVTKNGYNPEVAAERMYWSLKADAKHRDEFYQRAIREFPKARLEFFDHHYSHAAAAFYASPHDKACVVTADGRGDGQSLVVWDADRKTGLVRRKTVSELYSLGMMYSQVTSFLGFKPHRHEGKITGLAAYGSPSPVIDRIRDIFAVTNGDFTARYRDELQYKPFMSTESGWLKNLGITDREKVSYAAQVVLEELMVALIKHHVAPGTPLCLAGGIFGNVKLNQRIRELTSCGPIYVFPGMGDGGISFGACLASNVQNKIATSFAVPNMYLGEDPGWKDYNFAGLDVRRLDHKTIVAEAVQMLIANKVVGLSTGRMEYGPRALGARSILIATVDNEINAKVNQRLNRSDFMPFAPVTLRSQAAKMYVGWKDSDINTNYMTTCYDCTPEMKRMSPAVVHVDGTARPQVIDAGSVPSLYYDILAAYFTATGIPSLVNTSFNNHEEPIVCSADDAIDSLRKDNVDCVITDGMIISLPARR